MSVTRFGPRATYRIQLHPEFDFDGAIQVLDYVKALGVTHCYFAPYLACTRGSFHGYDVVDPTRVREDLGGAAGHARLCSALSERGLLHMVDVVPNHMGIESEDNLWWWDVLAQGEASAHARSFDIDWGADPERKLVLAILPCELDEALRTRYVGVARDAQGRAVLRVGGRFLPLRDAARYGDDELFTLDGQAEGMLRLLDEQHYRLHYYLTGLSLLNYRRFLDIGGLAAIRVEDEAVFEASHGLVLDWVRQGKVHAIRVDHPDGLSDPEGYFDRLRKAAPGAWLVGEKVLSPGEWLPENWAVDGTTGYEFLNLLNGLFVAPRAEVPLTEVLAAFTDKPVPKLADVLAEAKRQAIDELLAPEVSRLARLLVETAKERGLYADDARTRAALAALTLALPIGRSYARKGGALSVLERQKLLLAKERATAANPALTSDIALVYELVGEAPVGDIGLRFQQLTCAAMAKGVEDTALYRHLVLTSLNEVGADLDHFGHSLYDFHRFCQRATMTQPLSLLCTSTHDTKRAEDTRLRIDALSEMPEAWAEAVRTFRALNAHVIDRALDAETEYLLYQTLVGTFPISEARLSAYMLKAVREAKRQTSWLVRDEAYESAVLASVHAVLANADFLSALERFLVPLVRAARVHSLGQTLLKLTCPGIPDVYQGTELWDESLVDPDNRRPVDFEARKAMLAELQAGMTPAAILARMDEGLPKLWVLSEALKLREERAESFAPTARYEPLEVQSDPGERFIAFTRGADIAVVAQRFSHLAGSDDATLTLPPGRYENRLTGEELAGGRHALASLLAAFPVALLVRR